MTRCSPKEVNSITKKNMNKQGEGKGMKRKDGVQDRLSGVHRKKILADDKDDKELFGLVANMSAWWTATWAQ